MVYLPPAIFRELASLCEKGTLATVSLRVNLDDGLWMRGKREDRMRERRENRSRFAWYIDPTSPGFLTLEHIEWTERTLTLNRMPLSENAELAQAKKFQEAHRRRPIFKDRPRTRIREAGAFGVE
jgi:hypothetical protein